MPRWPRAPLDSAATPGTGQGHHSKAEKSLTVKLSEERYERLLLQNEKLRAEMSQLKGSTVNLETIRRQIVGANTTVKNHLLTLPDRVAGDLASMTDPFAIRALLKKAITELLNQLAYEGQNKEIR